ncbi:MAG: cellulose biosynthesis protein BcsQ [Bacillota bacterium]|nr:cellulose biosynthesis protein BcsQ [Bacillota bacterium]
MKFIAFVSAKGGTGRTTLAANLGVILARAGHRVLILDCDPQNALGTYLGMPPGLRVGIAEGSSSSEIIEYLAAQRGGVPYIPFGARDRDELQQAERTLAADSGWLLRRVLEIVPSSTELVLVDTPAGERVWTEHVLKMAHAIVGVHLPDAACFATLPVMAVMLERQCRGSELTPAVWHVLNQMEPHSELARDAESLLRQHLGERLVPCSVPRDPVVGEAWAQQLPVALHSPMTGAVAALRELSERLLTPLIDQRHAVTGLQLRGES